MTGTPRARALGLALLCASVLLLIGTVAYGGLFPFALVCFVAGLLLLR
jgi:energy-coupling factor transporter transmembrane protein EcfT